MDNLLKHIWVCYDLGGRLGKGITQCLSDGLITESRSRITQLCLLKSRHSCSFLIFCSIALFISSIDLENKCLINVWSHCQPTHKVTWCWLHLQWVVRNLSGWWSQGVLTQVWHCLLSTCPQCKPQQTASHSREEEVDHSPPYCASHFLPWNLELWDFQVHLHGQNKFRWCSRLF